MHTAHRKRTKHRYKTHWIGRRHHGGPFARSVCGHRLPLSVFTSDITKITCKTCQRRFAYWNKENPQ